MEKENMGIIRSHFYRKIGRNYVRRLAKATGDEVREAYVVGSAASGKADPGTFDVDLAIVVKHVGSVRKKAQELKKDKMMELSDSGMNFCIDYELFSQEDVAKNPNLIHKPKKRIYKAKK